MMPSALSCIILKLIGKQVVPADVLVELLMYETAFVNDFDAKG